MKAPTKGIVTGILFALVSGSAFACGESLYRVGKGVAFRQYTAPIPASILAVASTDAERLMLEQLAIAGHDVHVVATPAEISAELAEHEFDIVLAYYSLRDEVRREASESKATYLPVAMHDTEEERAARRAFRRSLASDDSVKRFLKTIHKTLKDRRRA